MNPPIVIAEDSKMVAERIEVIRRTVADCLKHSVNNACTWGHEADIQFLLQQCDQLCAALAEKDTALRVFTSAILALHDGGNMP